MREMETSSTDSNAGRSGVQWGSCAGARPAIGGKSGSYDSVHGKAQRESRTTQPSARLLDEVMVRK